MTTYQTAYTNLMQCLSTSGGYTFYGIWPQVGVALQSAAYTILGESTGTTNHANRVKWAKLILQDPLITAHAVTYGVMQDATIIANGTTAPTDAQVQAAVDAIVPDLVTGMVF